MTALPATGRLCLVLVLFLAACATPPAPPPGDVAFVVRAPLNLDVAAIVLDEQYGSPARPPHVEHLHRLSPAGVASAWSRSRLVAAGGAGAAIFSILDGSVVSEALEKKGGLTGLFGDQQDTKLTARLKVRMAVERPGPAGAHGSWTAEAEVNATRTILESASLNDRDAAYAALMQDLATRFDEEMSAEIRRSMGAVLK
ncbi:MAG: hypothetical protein WD034_00165 [Parvibaculum sp.]|uniref:hypothetical protein n=1 Tax=Parvibaculum sp. TaxID=2024848 RepID=UPI0034A05659